MIISSAPTRIDLAGGTLDLWPLHLFFENPPTLNAAINLYATVTLTPRRDSAIVLESLDQKKQARFASLAQLDKQTLQGHPLELILRLIGFYQPPKGFELTTHCQAPAGSGIGGSSALNIALNGALNRLTGNLKSRKALVEIAKNIETQVIRVPAGTQDYYSALNGGVQSIHSTFDGVHTEPLGIDLSRLQDRFLLCFSGKPRASGINNWQVYKQTIDGNSRVRRQLASIAKTTRQMEKRLRAGSLSGFDELFNAEWKSRQALAPGIATPAMKRMIASARRNGARAAKVCGAGGGGCIAFFIDPKRRQDVIRALEQLGGQILDFRFVRRGLKIETR